jgi:hypothetical protein
MKPNSPARARSLPAPAFILSTRAFAVVTLFALSCIFFSLSPPAPPARIDVAATASATPDPINRREPAPQRTAVYPAAVKPVAEKKEHRSQGEPEGHDAFAAAAAIPDPALREETLARLCYQKAESDPCGALDLAIVHGLEGAAGGVIGNLAQQWAAIDLPAAIAWVKTQPEGALREDLVARVGYVWSLDDPAGAAGFVAGETPAGEAQVEAAISVLHQWSIRDSGAARAWGECFPAGELRERALHEAGDPQPPR